MDINKSVDVGIKAGLIVAGKVAADQVYKKNPTYVSAGAKLVLGAVGAVMVPNAYVKSFALGVAVDGVEDGYLLYKAGKSSTSDGSTGGGLA